MLLDKQQFTNAAQPAYQTCWDRAEMKEKVVVLRELHRAIIYKSEVYLEHSRSAMSRACNGIVEHSS